MNVSTQQETRAKGQEGAAAQGRDFEADAATVLQRLRSALGEVIASVPGHVSKPAELQRALKIDINLGCKVFKVVTAPGPLAAGLHVPGLSALRTFLSAARKAGVGERIVSAAALAATDFDRMVASHAGDRAAFESMISPRAELQDARQIAMQYRRATFRGQRHIFGVEAKARLNLLVIQPAKDPRLLDFASISGYLALRQLRPNAPLTLSRVSTTDDDGTVREVRREPLDPAPGQAFGIALLRDFCSQPLPQYRTVQTSPGILCSELVSNGVGKQAAITCIEGYVARTATTRYRDEANRLFAFFGRVRIPCETLLLDLVVHEEAFGAIAPTAFACAEHQGEVAVPSVCQEWQRLEPGESVAHLGKGPSVLYTPDYPRYAELGRYVFERLGWDGERFNVYRCRVEYPVLPSSVVIAFDLPPAPGA